MQFRCCFFFGLALGLSARIGVAQQTREPELSRKSEAIATVWAVLPGAGHIYAGETTRGLLLAGATGLSFMYGLSDGQCKQPYTDVRTCELEKNESLAEASLIAAFALYAFSLWDAHDAARRANARRGLSLGVYEAAPTWILGISRTTQPYLGLGVELRKSRR